MSTATPAPRTLLLNAAALMVLLAATVGAAYLHLGKLGPVVTLAIAGAKATLVGLFFMHLRYGSRTAALFAAAGLFWLVILFSITLADYLTRT